MKIAIGSVSDIKNRAVVAAVHRLEILYSCFVMIKADSGQNEQPENYAETYAGAKRRASIAKETDQNAVAIGIENGIFNLGSDEDPEYFDIAVIVILTKDNREITLTSAGLPIPKQFVQKAKALGFDKNTVASVIAREIGGDPNDPHTILTGGKVSRVQVLIDALVTALSQL